MNCKGVETMIRTSQLHGRAVVDVDSATKLGELGELYLDLDRRAIAGLSVSQGGTLLGGAEHVTLPASAIQSYGEDAIMVRSGRPTVAITPGAAVIAPRPDDAGGPAAGLELATRASTLAGRAIVTASGTHLGHLDDILFDESVGRIAGYVYAERDDSPGPDFRGLFGLGRRREVGDASLVDYVRADADVRFGGDLIVVPDEAVVRDQSLDTVRLSENVTITRSATVS
jgi:sporulation protein YlmC with PRC-barrel domain